MADVFLVAYGSLMHPDSLRTTVPNHSAISSVLPCTLHSWKRSWNSNCTSRYSVVSARRTSRPTHTMNAALIRLEPTQAHTTLAALDSRESCYTRVRVPVDDLIAPLSELPPDSHVYIYSLRTVIPPSRMKPIAQTYLDIIIEGCLLLGGERFAKQFMESTHRWSNHHFELDRSSGNYDFTPRLFSKHIDDVLTDYILS